MPVERSRLVAQYDFVAADAGQRWVIVDWKTTRKRPRREDLLDRLQTRVYPYLLVRAGSVLNDGVSIQPEQVSMVYWFANFPAAPMRFEYSMEQCEADRRFLSGLVGEIEERFDRTGGRQLVSARPDDGSCRYCRYRSLCERGATAGLRVDMVREEEIEPLTDVAVDFEQMAEIAYG
jgi:predicted RecB family nuclease